MQRRHFLSLAAAAASTALLPVTALAGDTIHIAVKTLTGKSIEIDVNPAGKVLDIKEAVLKKEGIPVDMQRLIFSGKLLDNAKTLSGYNILEGSILHLVLKLG